MKLLSNLSSAWQVLADLQDRLQPLAVAVIVAVSRFACLPHVGRFTRQTAAFVNQLRNECCGMFSLSGLAGVSRPAGQVATLSNQPGDGCHRRGAAGQHW